MSFDLKSLELFVRVAALGAIGRAGAEFGLSSTNASQRIKTLEDELDVRLLNRTTRVVSLTPDGAQFLEHARRILDEVELAQAALSQKTQSMRGLLRVTASSSFGRSYIVPFVAEFLREHPKLRLELNLSDAVIDIVEQGYDLAFRLGQLAPSSLLAQKIDIDHKVLVAAPSYLERAGVPQRPEDLLQHACVPFAHQRDWQLMAPGGTLHEVRVSGPVDSNLGDAVGQWVLDGVGIGLASLWHCGPALQSGRLVRVLEDYRVWPEKMIWAVRPPGRVMHPRVEAFIDFMRTRIHRTNAERYGSLLTPESRESGE